MLQRGDAIALAPPFATSGTLARVLWRHRLVCLPAIAYATAVAVLLHLFRIPSLYNVRWHYPFLDTLFLWFGLALAAVSFGNRRFLATFTMDRVASAAIVWALVPVFCDSFSSWKQAVGQLAPFGWDASLYALDRTLHGGKAPWEWLFPFMSAPLVRTLDFVYAAWFTIVMATIVGFAWSRESHHRQRFLVSVVLVWAVLGSVAATLFGSAGPCYYFRLVPGPDPYAPLLARLDQFVDPPLIARRLQGALWQWKESGGWHSFGGVSAMPSVHVAMTATVAFGWGGAGRLPAALGWLLVALTLVGSVVLGWHYAIDGYFGVTGAVAIWWVAGRMAERAVNRTVAAGTSDPADLD